MRLEKNPRSREWTPITLEEIKKKFHKNFYLDMKSLSLYCEKSEKDWTIDVRKENDFVLIMFVSEDVSWMYEVESEKSEYYRQLYLARDDLHFLLRRMNEKRKIRKV